MTIKSLRRISIAVLSASVLFITSCEKDSSTPESASDDRDRYIKSWTCSETSQQQGNSNYTITISKDNTTANQILVKNFYQLGTNTTTIMIVDGNNVTISSQVVSGYTLHGSGHYNSSSSLTFNFTAYDGITTDTASISAH